MTKIDRYEEIEVRVRHSWEAACYWCAKVFTKLRRGPCVGWREHVNVEHETKTFCSKDCKNEWIYHKQAFGELMP